MAIYENAPAFVQPPSDGQLRELAASFIAKAPQIITSFADAQYWIAHKGKFEQTLREILALGSVKEELSLWDVKQALREQTFFCWNTLGIATDCANMRIPENQTGFGWILVVPTGLSYKRVLELCSERFSVRSAWGECDLDEIIPSNERFSNQGAYAIRARNRREADLELEGVSAQGLDERRVRSITLLERLLLELQYFERTSQHLDVQNITMCAGSRDIQDAVPTVRWRDGHLVICCHDNKSTSEFVRAREVLAE